VAFSVPSNYFDSLAERAIIESNTIEQLCVELAKIEEYYIYQLKEGVKPAQISDKVRAAMVQKIQELKMSSSFSK
jgi:16S rRNA G527 N7-methylase RsmG